MAVKVVGIRLQQSTWKFIGIAGCKANVYVTVGGYWWRFVGMELVWNIDRGVCVDVAGLVMMLKAEVKIFWFFYM